jgi:RNA polymerase sigma factor (sigma-70 family)
MGTKPSRKKEWNLTEEAFGRFLSWLNPDPDQAGRKYEEIRSRLIKIFTCRGCTIPEDLTDETINRVIRRIQDIGDSYSGDPALYFYGVAHNVFLESVRKKPEPEPPPAPDPPAQVEMESECLEECLERLTPDSRNLVLEYYQQEKRAKIDRRKRMADGIGIPLNALRIRAHRIRANLQICLFQCLEEKRVV